MGEEQEGLGMIQGASQAPDGEAKFVAKPNISLERYSNNVVNDIKNQAKQELMQEMAKRQAMEQAVRAREARAIDYGRGVGINEGLDLGLAKGYEYASRGYDPYASSDEDSLYEDDYNMQEEMDIEGLGLR